MEIPIVVVYRKSPTAKRHYISVLENTTVDDIINARKKKPPLPHEYEIDEIGIGAMFVDRYMKEYKIKKITKL